MPISKTDGPKKRWPPLVLILIMLFSPEITFSHEVEVFPLPLNLASRSQITFFNEYFDSTNLRWNPEPFFSTNIASTAQTQKTFKNYDLKQATSLALRNSFESRLGMQNLYQAHLKVFERASALVPKINLNFGMTAPFINVGTLFFGLFGVFVPSNWFDFYAAKEQYQSELCAMASILFTQYTMMQQVYIDIHKMQMHLEIFKYYLAYFKSVIDLIKKDKIPRSIYDASKIESYYYGLNTRAYEIAYEIYKTLPEFATGLGFDEKIGFIDIGELNWPIYPEIPQYEDILSSALRNSFELKSLDHLIEERENWKWGRSLSFFNITDSVHLNLGGSAIFGTLYAKSDIEMLKIRHAKTRSEISAEVRQVIYRLKTALKADRTASKGSQIIQASLSDYLIKYLNTPLENRDISEFLYLMDITLAHQIKLNETRHNYFVAFSQFERLTLQRYAEVTRLLGEDEKFKVMFEFLKKENHRRLISNWDRRLLESQPTAKPLPNIGISNLE